LTAAAIPLAITPGLFFHFDITPKIILLALAAAVGLARIRSLPREIAELRRRREGRLLILLAGAQLVWFGVTALTSSRPWFSVYGSGWRRLGLVEIASILVAAVLAAANLAARPEGTRTVLRIAVAAGFVAAVYGICEYFSIDPLQPVAAYQAHAGDSVIVRPPGTMGHADYFGWWLALEFFCGIALLRIERGVWKCFAALASVTIASAIILSGTRAAILAVVCGVAAMIVMQRRAGLRIRARNVIAASAACVLCVAFYFSPAGTLLRARVVWSGDEPLGGARPLLWRDSLRMAGARPLTGFGPETYLTAFAPYQSEELSRLFPDYHHESPHNLGFDALTSMGIPGLLLLIAWGVLAWRAAAAARRSGSVTAGPLAAACIASAAASMFSAASPGPLLLSFLVLAILMAESPLRDAAPAPSLPPAQLLAPALAAGFLVFAGFLGVYEFRLQQFSRQPGEASYRRMLRASLPGAADDLYASRLLQLECQRRTGIASYVGCIQQTLQTAARALKTDDDIANAWYNLAMLSAVQKNLNGTREGLLEASRASPNWFKPHWTLANLLLQSGEKTQAKAQAARAAFLDSNRDPEVVETLTKLTRD
ncbi:MAG TPA: O-antigen ligase family protein, partial [Bryobacteraceae bacterium]|nr:O-antigen ligase family protein [Bryobacteraceae bacterium]